MKSYKQFCGVAKALDLVGERWTLLIVRDLLLGPRRFTDLQQSLAGLTPNTLSKRLRELSEAGITEPVTKPVRGYRLTRRGLLLEDAVLALGRFGAEYMQAPAQGERIDARWIMVSLKRKYLGCTIVGSATLQLGSETFYLRFGGPRLEVLSVEPPHRTNIALRGALSGWFPLLTRQNGLAALEKLGQLERRGNVRTAKAFIKSLGMLG